MENAGGMGTKGEMVDPRGSPAHSIHMPKERMTSQPSGDEETEKQQEEEDDDDDVVPLRGTVVLRRNQDEKD